MGSPLIYLDELKRPDISLTTVFAVLRMLLLVDPQRLTCKQNVIKKRENSPQKMNLSMRLIIPSQEFIIIGISLY